MAKGSRTTSGSDVTSHGLEPNLAGALSYLLWFVTGILFLLIEKDNKFVRFHAMQSTLTFGFIFVVWLIINVIPILGMILGFLLWILSIALWILLMYKAYQGEEYLLPFIGEIARDQVSK